VFDPPFEQTDGVDPDSCEHVLIEDVDYCGGDDVCW
jgi:polygalacturonase